MKLQFCTLFDSGYLSRGLAMYKSLLLHCDDFHLYVFAFDDKVFDYFSTHSYENLTVISLESFEDEELRRVKPSRTTGEYCWTCSSSTILYCLENFNLDHCTYVDADLLFYESPTILIEEMLDKDVLITEHRYTDEYDQSADSGIFCVQFITFRSTTAGLQILNWWRDRCLEWCFARMEDGKFGDQKYLDDWPERFVGVHVLRHHGGGLAPWNIQQYSFRREADRLLGVHIRSGETFSPVFFHFHALKVHADRTVSLTGAQYMISRNAMRSFYSGYVHALESAKDEILRNDPEFGDPHGMVAPSIKSFKESRFLRPLACLKSRLMNGPSQKHHFHNYSITDLLARSK